MILLLIVGFVGVFLVVVASGGRQRVSWMRQLYRLPRHGHRSKGVWMAPDTVVEQVRKDYISAVQWLQESMLQDWERRWAVAPTYLEGGYLRRYQSLLLQHRLSNQQLFAGVLRADHRVMVSEFCDDGESCILIDQQQQRRMATYYQRTGERVTTQDLGSGAVVFKMVYDPKLRRWKISEYIQELPLGWGQQHSTAPLRMVQDLPPNAGRDN